MNQKLLHKQLEIKDCVTDLGEPSNLVALLEVLSEQDYPGKIKASNIRIQRINNAGNALKWCWQLGVHMELKPSPENLVDGDSRQVLGLVWGIMQRFMRFGSDDDEEESKHSADEALLMWLQNQVRERF